MANEPAFYVLVDDAWHEMASDEATVCGKRIGFKPTWQRDVPDKVHCGVNKTAAPKPAAKAAAKKPAKAKK